MSSAMGFLACVFAMPLVLAAIAGMVVGMYYLCIAAGASDAIAFTAAMCTVFIPIGLLLLWCVCGCRMLPYKSPKVIVHEVTAPV